MTTPDLQGVADAVVHRAQRQGSVTPAEVRDELARAGQPETLWKDVLALVRASLSYRGGRYHFITAVSDRKRQEEKHLQAVRRAVRQVLRHRRQRTQSVERRQHERIDFVQPVKVQTADRREHTLVTCDLSPAGIRLIGTRQLLGQKVEVTLGGGEGAPAWRFVVRILWTCAIGEDLFENGGMFLEAVESV